MSTSLVYHGFGIKGYSHVRTRYIYGQIWLKIQQDPFSLKCSACNSKDFIRRGFHKRTFRTIPIGPKTVFIELYVQRIECLSCHLIRQVKISFADERRTYTKAFERYALELSRHMTILDVARHLNVSWDIIKDIQKRYLKKHFSRPKLKTLNQIAIDEISIGKGHRYLTVVLDLETGAVVFVAEGKGSDTLKPFWRLLNSSKAKVAAIAIDMSPAYISAVTNNLPDAIIVFDHFHVIKLFNDRLSDLRRTIQREAEDDTHKEVLKGTRWLLLKNPENLDEEKNESQRLKKALELNRPLATAYYLKEDLRQLWNRTNKKTARNFLARWIDRANSSEIPMLINFANTLSVHEEGILAYYDYPISTGPLEGTNNKIKTLQRQAYGFRDMEFFRLKIYALHMTKYALVG